MRRVFSTALIGLGAFLIMAAVLVKFYAHPNLATMPTNYESTTELQAIGASIFDADTLEPKTTDLAISSYTIADSDVATPDGVVVWVNRTSILDTSVDGATCDPAVDPALPGCFQQSSDRSPFDSQTGAAAECPDCGSYADESYDDGGSYAVRQVDVTRSGQIYKGPFDMKKEDLQWWDSSLAEATTMKYVGTEKIDGLETYKYVQTIEPTQIGTRDLPGSVFGSEDATITANEMYGMVRTIWFEPTTGSPVKRTENRNQYFDYDGQQVDAFVGTVEYTPDTVADLVSDGKTQGFVLGGMVWLFPLLMILLGLLFIAGGVALSRGGRGQEGTRKDERELVSA
ncbi:hypothetical protein BH09ACT12_BH09ACT12_02850 [soil metagenome]